MPLWLDRLQHRALLTTAFLYSAGYATIGLVLVLLSVISEGLVQRRLPWRRSPLDIFIVVFITVFLLSGALSAYRPMALGTTGLAAVTIYLSFGPTARTLQRRQASLRPLLRAWLLGGAVAAVAAIVIHLQTGTPAHTPELGQNAVGTTMLIATLIALGFVVLDRPPWRYVAAVCGILTFTALVLSYTRGAWLGFFLGIVIVAALGGLRASRSGVLAAIVMVAAGAVLAGSERSSLVQRALTIPSVSANIYRVYLYRSAVAIFSDHPIVGTGMGTFPIVYPQYRFPGDVNEVAQPYAHNVYLNMAAEGGLLGLGAFLALLGRTLHLGWRWWARAPTPTEQAWRSVLLAAFAGMLGHQLFDGTLISVHLGIGMWMFTAMLTSFRS